MRINHGAAFIRLFAQWLVLSGAYGTLLETVFLSCAVAGLRVKEVDKGNMKKRYILLGLIALDILCFPLAAQLLHKVSQLSFSAPAHAIVSELPRNEPGVAHLVVTASEPFILTAANLNGAANIEVRTSGRINTTPFGDNAQMPGLKASCMTASGETPSIIYTADKATSVKGGEVLSQSVIFTVHFPKEANPNFKVSLKEDATDQPHAAACEGVST